jgi:hypothetical protein
MNQYHSAYKSPYAIIKNYCNAVRLYKSKHKHMLCVYCIDLWPLFNFRNDAWFWNKIYNLFYPHKKTYNLLASLLLHPFVIFMIFNAFGFLAFCAHDLYFFPYLQEVEYSGGGLNFGWCSSFFHFWWLHLEEIKNLALLACCNGLKGPHETWLISYLW